MFVRPSIHPSTLSYEKQISTYKARKCKSTINFPVVVMVLFIGVALTLGYKKHNLMAYVRMCTLLNLHLIILFLTFPETVCS